MNELKEVTQPEDALIEFLRNFAAPRYQVTLLKFSNAWSVEIVDFESTDAPVQAGGESFDEAWGKAHLQFCDRYL